MNKEIISTLLLAIMLLSPFAFADGVKLMKVSELEERNIIINSPNEKIDEDCQNNNFNIISSDFMELLDDFFIGGISYE